MWENRRGEKKAGAKELAAKEEWVRNVWERRRKKRKGEGKKKGRSGNVMRVGKESVGKMKRVKEEEEMKGERKGKKKEAET